MNDIKINQNKKMDLLNLGPGDQVVIRDNGYDYYYTIVDINENVIRVIEYDAVSEIIYDLKTEQWLKDGITPISRVVKRKLDYPTMLNLYADELISICRYHLTPICDDENFWFDKINQDYSYLAIKYKPENETYKQQYHAIRKFQRNLYFGFRPDRIDFALGEVIYNAAHPHTLETAYLMIVGDPEIWNYIKKQIIHVLNESSVIHTYLFDRINSTNILYWMLDQEELISNNEVLRQISTYAAKLGDLNILNIVARYGKYPSYPGIVEAAKKGYMDIFKWSVYNNLIRDEVISTVVYDKEILNSPHLLEIYEILYENNLLHEYYLQVIEEWAERENRIEILNWLRTLHGRYP